MTVEIEMAYTVTELLGPDDCTLVTRDEYTWVQETRTGLRFADGTPIEVWAAVVTRLLTQHKRIEWALADAINFGARRYGEMYSQWVEQTQLAKKTLANIAWVGRSIERSRRREDLDFSYHAEVAALPPKEQDRLLDAAVEQGMTRYDLRDAARARKRDLEGKAETADGTPIPTPDLPWAPTEADLSPAALAALTNRAPQGRLRSAYVAGFCWAMQWAGVRDAFTDWQGD